MGENVTVVNCGSSKPPEPHGYHLRKIEKGVLGQLSKVREELEEAEDAHDQQNPVMVLVELSDMVGAIDAYLFEHFGGSISIQNLNAMAQATARAFRAGRRT